jgi:cysteinyl-tRNA synthetase
MATNSAMVGLSLSLKSILNTMRHPFLIAKSCVLALMIFSSVLRAEDSKTKSNTDKTKDMLDKLIIEAKKSAGKLQEGGDKGNTLWNRSKETLALPKDDYLKRANSAMKSMDAEIKALTEAESAVMSRDYFKTHVQSLKQHLAYCQQDVEKLKSSDSEESFRVKQKKFDRTLGFLADNIQLTKEEAGL